MGIGHIIERHKETFTNSYELATMESIKICRFRTFRVGVISNILSNPISISCIFSSLVSRAMLIRGLTSRSSTIETIVIFE